MSIRRASYWNLWQRPRLTVQSDQLPTEDVVTRSQARGNGDGNNTIVGDQFVDSGSSASETIFIDFEPARPGGGGEGIIDLGHVHHDGALQKVCAKRGWRGAVHSPNGIK